MILNEQEFLKCLFRLFSLVCGGVCGDVCILVTHKKSMYCTSAWTAVYHLFDFSSQSGFILEYITKALLNKIDSGFQKTNSQC